MSPIAEEKRCRARPRRALTAARKLRLKGRIVRISDLIQASEMTRLMELSKQMREITAAPSYLAEWAETQRKVRESMLPRSALADMAATVDHSYFRLSESLEAVSAAGSRIAEMLGPTATERLALAGIGRQLQDQVKLPTTLPGLAEQSRLAEAMSPLVEAQKRMAEVMGSHSPALQKSLAGISTLPSFLPPDVFQRLDGIAAASFLEAFEGPESIRALRKWTESLSATALGFSDAAAQAFGDLVEEEFEEVTAMVAADPAALEGMTVLDFLLALQNAWGALRDYPIARSALLVIVTALVQGEVQKLLSAGDHAEMMAEMRRQTTLLEQQAHALRGVGEVGPRARTERRGVVIRNAYIRVGPDVASTSLGMLTKDDTVLILGREGDWLRVVAGLPGGEIHSGWVYARLVKAVL